MRGLLWWKKLERYDWVLVVAMVMLLAFGFGAITSVELSRGASVRFLEKQAVALFLGTAIGGYLATRPPSAYRLSARFLYYVAVALLAGVLIFGETFNGTTGWFVIFGYAFQPLDFAKLAVVLDMAALLAQRIRPEFPLRDIGRLLFRLAVPVGLLILQPDLGGALIILGVGLMMMLVAGLPWRYVVMAVLAGSMLFSVGWYGAFRDYQRQRIVTFLNPESDPLGQGYNVIQAKVAIGSGGLLGRGIGGGSQSQLRFLPESQTDFIFAVIAEELGLIGVVVLLSSFFLLLYRLHIVALRQRDRTAMLQVLGIACLLFLQGVIHIGANLALLPATGVPFPLVSYGGTSLLFTLILLGIVESAAFLAPRTGAYEEA